MRRREFVFTPALAATAAQTSPSLIEPDSVTNPAGLEYFLLGDGRIMLGIQRVETTGAGTQAGLVLMSSEHLNRKTGSLLWHPRTALAATRAVVVIDGKPHTPEPGGVKFGWTYPGSIPTIRLNWAAGGCGITEDFWCAEGESAVIHKISVENMSKGELDVLLLRTLRPNPLLFDEYEVDSPGARLIASGYHQIVLTATGVARAAERSVEVKSGKIGPGLQAEGQFIVSVDRAEKRWDAAAISAARSRSQAFWQPLTAVESGDADLDRMFRASCHTLRAVVANSGKMDGGPWGYNLEWVRDASMTASGCILAGLPSIGEAVLSRILTRMISDNGAALDSSFHRPPETIELDQNGQVLCSLWTHWAWTGSEALIRKHWQRIRATADFALDEKFRDARTGLVKNSREFWERSIPYGVREGYELTYQVWNIAGWDRAAEMAKLMGDTAAEARWTEAAALMRRSFLSDARFSFVHEGRFIKRKLSTGEPQFTMEPPDRSVLPPGMPLRTESISYCDPDAGNVFPALLGVVDPRSEVALRTLESMETLWNQRWDIGGYGRYHVTSEPDSPGPWPFATLFIARAYLEAGNSEKVWRALRWLASVPGGQSGTWFEYYGPRPIPPLPPVAIIPWTSAELVTLVVHHLLGVRPDLQGLTIRPRLLDGLDSVSSRLQVNGHELRLKVLRTGGRREALIDGRPVEFSGDAIRMARPQHDVRIEMRL